MLVANNDVLHFSELVYSENSFKIKEKPNNIDLFVSNYNNDNFSKSNIQYIEIPVLVIKTLHSCYSHAVIDCLFPMYWICKELDIKNPILFIRQKEILKYSKNNLPLIGDTNYIGVWGELKSLLTEKDVIFEHKIPKNKTFKFKHIYFYKINDNYKRSPWNNQLIYPGRNANVKDIRFSEEIINTCLKNFKNHVLKYYNFDNLSIENEVIIIERMKNRKWTIEILDKLRDILNKLNFNFSIVILENMTLQQQVKLFSSHKVYFLNHGSALTNLLWIPEKSLIFEFDTRTNRTEILKKISDVSNSNRIFLNTNKPDYKLITNSLSQYIL